MSEPALGARRSLLLRVIFATSSVPATPAAEDLFVVFWNVENLFDLRDYPDLDGGDGFTPKGPKRGPGRHSERSSRISVG